MQAALAATSASNIVKITVANQAARYALTQAQVQNGDYVYQADTATLYEVIDQTLLSGAAGYVALATVTAAQISDASVAGRALLTGNVSIGSGSDAVTLETFGDTLLQLPASGRLGTSSVLLTNHQALNGTTLVTAVVTAASMVPVARSRTRKRLGMAGQDMRGLGREAGTGAGTRRSASRS